MCVNCSTCMLLGNQRSIFLSTSGLGDCKVARMGIGPQSVSKRWSAESSQDGQEEER